VGEVGGSNPPQCFGNGSLFGVEHPLHQRISNQGGATMYLRGGYIQCSKCWLIISNRTWHKDWENNKDFHWECWITTRVKNGHVMLRELKKRLNMTIKEANDELPNLQRTGERNGQG